MPKRMLDDSYLNSPSLDRCSARAQDSFPRFILLADDFGCFEADARRLLALGWSSRRRDVTEDAIVEWLEEYVAAGMAVLWTEAERRYCYLTGWNGPHGQRKREEYDPAAPKGTPAYHGSKRRTPPPPAELVAAVLAGYRRGADGKPPGTAREATGKDDPENLSSSPPAREITGNGAGNAREIRGSAAAVPVAVAVPFAFEETTPLVSFLLATYPDIKKPWACEQAWSKAYPGIDLLAEALKAKAWETANPKKAKSDHASFLNRWFKNAQKDAQAKAPPPAINGDRFWDYLTPEEREQYRRERTAIDPELAEAPFGATGVKHEAAVVQLHRRWAELVSWKARTA